MGALLSECFVSAPDAIEPSPVKRARKPRAKAAPDVDAYAAHLESKRRRVDSVGFAPTRPLNPRLFPYQADLVRWALARGRAALFAGTGLGKSGMELEWASHVAEHTGKPVLLLTPLAVARQMAREAVKFGIGARVIREQSDVTADDRIFICNYDRLHLLDASAFGGVVLDEASILKSYDGSTKKALCESFASTKYRLSCTATPAPNDHEELGNQCEFLGVMSRTEMLATFFTHDGGETQKWRLKGHARQEFWAWVCSWGVVIRSPEDLGHDGASHKLPPLRTHEHRVETDDTDARAGGMLFTVAARTLTEQRASKKASLAKRIDAVAALVAAEPHEPWLIWCDLNAEGDALESAIPGAVQVAGADTSEWKENAAMWFTGDYGEPCTCGTEVCRCKGLTDRRRKIMISKGAIFGMGLNFQSCARMAFVGVTHSFEGYFQAIRRCWRFGQTREVHVHLVLGDGEEAILDNLRRKERDAATLGAETAAVMRQTQLASVRGMTRETIAYNPTRKFTVPTWLRSQEKP